MGEVEAEGGVGKAHQPRLEAADEANATWHSFSGLMRYSLVVKGLQPLRREKANKRKRKKSYDGVMMEWVSKAD